VINSAATRAATLRERPFVALSSQGGSASFSMGCGPFKCCIGVRTPLLMLAAPIETSATARPFASKIGEPDCPPRGRVLYLNFLSFVSDRFTVGRHRSMAFRT
jgi:hypothetical protein